VLFVWFFTIQTGDQEAQQEFETTIIASIAAVALAEIASLGLQWPAPNRGQLGALFPDYIVRSPAATCFPSQSTAVYGAIASGVLAWRRHLGVILWIAVVLLVALPRMYVGGHYLTDVIVGAACAFGGYFVAHLLAQRPGLPLIVGRAGRSQWLASLVVFIFIWQVSVDFREVFWLFNSLHYFVP
jgi:membrane-associated phospholipid phosphatase